MLRNATSSVKRYFNKPQRTLVCLKGILDKKQTHTMQQDQLVKIDVKQILIFVAPCQFPYKFSRYKIIKTFFQSMMTCSLTLSNQGEKHELCAALLV